MNKDRFICCLIALIFCFVSLVVVYFMLKSIESALEEAKEKIEQQHKEIEFKEQLYEEMLNLQKNRCEEKVNELKKIEAIVTGYAPFDNQSGMCADNNPSVTSTGKMPSSRFAAADPTRLPYGTKVKVPGYGVVEIQDTGGALRGDKENIRIDLFFDTYDEALRWGIKEKVVQIVL